MLESYRNQWDLTIHMCTIKHPRNYLQELCVEMLFEVDFNPAAISILEILSFVSSGPKLNLCWISYWQVILYYTKEGFALSSQQMEMNSTYCKCDEEDPLKYCQWGNRAMTMVLRVHEIFWFILFWFHKQNFLVQQTWKLISKLALKPDFYKTSMPWSARLPILRNQMPGFTWDTWEWRAKTCCVCFLPLFICCWTGFFLIFNLILSLCRVHHLPLWYTVLRPRQPEGKASWLSGQPQYRQLISSIPFLSLGPCDLYKGALAKAMLISGQFSEVFSLLHGTREEWYSLYIKGTRSRLEQHSCCCGLGEEKRLPD